MDYASIAILIGTVLAAASVIFGAKYNQGKAKAIGAAPNRGY
jgi:hypothetical protein